MTGHSEDLLDIRPVVRSQNRRVRIGVFVKEMIDFLGEVAKGVPQRQKGRGRVEDAPEVEIKDVGELLLGFEELTEAKALERERHGDGELSRLIAGRGVFLEGREGCIPGGRAGSDRTGSTACGSHKFPAPISERRRNYKKYARNRGGQLGGGIGGGALGGALFGGGIIRGALGAVYRPVCGDCQ